MATGDIDHERLKRLVEGSGFPFQMGVKAHIERTTSEHGWRPLSEEHHWRHPQCDREGFLDLVVTHERDLTWLTIECKRTTGSQWVFLVPKDSTEQERLTFLWGYRRSSDLDHFGWLEYPTDPKSLVSSYCIVKGQDERREPMLERIAGELLIATEAYASLAVSRLDECLDCISTFLPVIVTNTPLYVCRLDPADVDLEVGVPRNSTFHQVPYIHFRKTFGATPVRTYSRSRDRGATCLHRAQVRSVFVVCAEDLTSFLKALRIHPALDHDVTSWFVR